MNAVKQITDRKEIRACKIITREILSKQMAKREKVKRKENNKKNKRRMK